MADLATIQALSKQRGISLVGALAPEAAQPPVTQEAEPTVPVETEASDLSFLDADPVTEPTAPVEEEASDLSFLDSAPEAAEPVADTVVTAEGTPEYDAQVEQLAQEAVKTGGGKPEPEVLNAEGVVYDPYQGTYTDKDGKEIYREGSNAAEIGGAKGFSFSTNDELGSLFASNPQLYRDVLRRKEELAAEQDPLGYYTGVIGGGVAALATGGAVKNLLVKGGTSALTSGSGLGARALTAAKGSALLGGVEGAANDTGGITDRIGGATSGAVLGGAIGALGPVAGTVTSKAGSLASSGMAQLKTWFSSKGSPTHVSDAVNTAVSTIADNIGLKADDVASRILAGETAQDIILSTGKSPEAAAKILNKGFKGDDRALNALSDVAEKRTENIRTGQTAIVNESDAAIATDTHAAGAATEFVAAGATPEQINAGVAAAIKSDKGSVIEATIKADVRSQLELNGSEQLKAAGVTLKEAEIHIADDGAISLVNKAGIEAKETAASEAAKVTREAEAVAAKKAKAELAKVDAPLNAAQKALKVTKGKRQTLEAAIAKRANGPTPDQAAKLATLKATEDTIKADITAAAIKQAAVVKKQAAAAAKAEKAKPEPVPETDGYTEEDLIPLTGKLVDGTIFRRTSAAIEKRALSDVRPDSPANTDQGFDLLGIKSKVDNAAVDSVPGKAEADALYSQAQNAVALRDATSALVSKGAKATAADAQVVSSALASSGLTPLQQLKIASGAMANSISAETIPVISNQLKLVFKSLPGGDTVSSNAAKLVDELSVLSKSGDPDAIHAYKTMLGSSVSGAADTLSVFSVGRGPGTNALFASLGAVKGFFANRSKATPEQLKAVFDTIINNGPEMADVLAKVLKKKQTGDIRRAFVDEVFNRLSTGTALAAFGIPNQQ